MIAIDALVVVAAYLLADYLRCRFWMGTEWPEAIGGTTSSVRIHMKVLAFLPAIWAFSLNQLGWYAPKWRPRAWLIRTALSATGILILSMAALALLLERELYPRAQMGFVALLLPATTLVVRGITEGLGRLLGDRKTHHVLIVGTQREAVRVRRLFRRVGFGAPVVVGHLRGPWEDGESAVESRLILGGVEELGPILDGRVVDEVVFTTPIEHMAVVLDYVRLCEEVGVAAHIQAESMTCHSVPEITQFHGLPLLAYSPSRHSPELLAIKRFTDIALSIVGIVLTGPIMLLCAGIIKATSPGPVLFRQLRSGLNGREFHMFKFRTMDPNAEREQAKFAHLNESSGPVFKIRNDPRVTRIGRVLRRWSVDELPQLFNVLIGDMSIVGPRPPIPAEVAKYDRWQRRRLSMRPGLTCIWQIKGRHRIGFQEWMELDLLYIDHWSLRLDFRILWRTISTVLSGSGA